VEIFNKTIKSDLQSVIKHGFPCNTAKSCMITFIGGWFALIYLWGKAIKMWQEGNEFVKNHNWLFFLIQKWGYSRRWKTKGTSVINSKTVFSTQCQTHRRARFCEQPSADVRTYKQTNGNKNILFFVIKQTNKQMCIKKIFCFCHLCNFDIKYLSF